MTGTTPVTCVFRPCRFASQHLGPPATCARPPERYTKTMANAEIQIVSNEAGEPTAVLVPIELWREIESERETAYLLQSETMKQRLLAAKQRQDGISLEAVGSPASFETIWIS